MTTRLHSEYRIRLRNVTLVLVAGALIGTPVGGAPCEEDERDLTRSVTLRASADGRSVVLQTVESGDPMTLEAESITVTDIGGAQRYELVVDGAGGVVLTATPERPRARIGVTVEPISEALGAHMDLGADEVIIVTDALEDGPARAAGIRRHDIITHIDGHAPVTPDGLRETIGAKAPGDEIRLRVRRRGVIQDLVVTVVAETAVKGDLRYLELSASEDLLGTYRYLRPEAMAEYRLSTPVIVSPDARLDFEAGVPFLTDVPLVGRFFAQPVPAIDYTVEPPDATLLGQLRTELAALRDRVEAMQSLVDRASEASEN